jgi:hypothetical protein
MKTTQEPQPDLQTTAQAAAQAATAAASSAAIVATNIDWIKKDITEIKESLKCLNQEYVTQVEFRPIKAIVFGMVGVILVGVVGALLALVIIR